MKNQIKISALAIVFGLFTTGVFAAEKATKDTTATSPDAIHILSPASNDLDVNVAIHKAAPGKSMVTIYDDAKNVVLKDALSKNSENIQKSYNFEGMDNGDYTIEVSTDSEVVEKTIHVYSDENDQRLFLMQ